MAEIDRYAVRSGNLIAEDGSVKNIVTLLGGGDPVTGKSHDIAKYAPQSGRVLGEDGQVYNLVDLLQSIGGGSGGESGPVTWENVIDKPTTFPASEHDHDDRYYRKEEIDAHEFLASRVDRETVDVEQGELKAKKLAGLQPNVEQLNTWLNGTEKNLQIQIDDLKLTLAALSAGMRYRGKFETHAELQGVNNKDGGDLAVVLADESRGGVRSMYVYNDTLGMWDFIGAFEFSDAFTALTDTPSGYDNGKVLRSGSAGLFYDVVRWAEIADKPVSTKAQIDGAVQQAHGHQNIADLDRFGVDAQGRLTIDGVPYVPASQPVQKQWLFAVRTTVQASLAAGTTCVCNSIQGGNIPYSTTTGVFTLEAGKTYRIQFTASINVSGWIKLGVVNTSNASAGYNNAIWTNIAATTWNESSAGPLVVYLKPTTTQGYKINVISMSGTASLRAGLTALDIQEI